MNKHKERSEISKSRISVWDDEQTDHLPVEERLHQLEDRLQGLLQYFGFQAKRSPPTPALPANNTPPDGRLPDEHTGPPCTPPPSNRLSSMHIQASPGRIFAGAVTTGPSGTRPGVSIAARPRDRHASASGTVVTEPPRRERRESGLSTAFVARPPQTVAAPVPAVGDILPAPARVPVSAPAVVAPAVVAPALVPVRVSAKRGRPRKIRQEGTRERPFEIIDDDDNDDKLINDGPAAAAGRRKGKGKVPERSAPEPGPATKRRRISLG